MSSDTAEIRQRATKIEVRTAQQAAPPVPAARTRYHKPPSDVVIAARRLKPGQWYERLGVERVGGWTVMDRRIALQTAGAMNGSLRVGKVKAAAYAAQGGQTGAEWRVVVVYSDNPGKVPDGMGTAPVKAAGGAVGAELAVRSDAEKAAERARLERKLSGRGPVAGFDSPGKSGRARAIRNTESEE